MKILHKSVFSAAEDTPRASASRVRAYSPVPGASLPGRGAKISSSGMENVLLGSLWYTFVFGCLTLFALPAQAESLWLRAGSNVSSHYGDHRACRPGDILTIIISEEIDITATQETKADKDSTVNDSVASFLYANSNFGKYKGEMPSVETSSTNQYKGKGNITVNQSVSAQAAVMVTDVLPNGNLVIEGLRSIIFANEKQYMMLRGIVRADDISASNTIDSNLIANAYVEIKGEGDLSSAQHKGWLLKLNDFLNPF